MQLVVGAALSQTKRASIFRVHVPPAAVRKFRARMDAEVGRLLSPEAKCAAQMLGWQGAGFVGGVVETRKLAPNKLPVAFMVD